MAKEHLKDRVVFLEATNGGIANVHVAVASVDPSPGSRGQASFGRRGPPAEGP